jgi:hypothetical protein
VLTPDHGLQTASDLNEPTAPVRRAGFWIRVAATMLDVMLLSPVIVLQVYLLKTSDNLLLLAVLVVPPLFYKPLMEWRYGATVGKMIC